MQPNTTLTRIKEVSEIKASKALEERRHKEAQQSAIATQETILKAFNSLVRYLDDPRRVTKTSITNQLKEIGTPDAMKVVEAVNDLHSTLKTHENVDLSEIASLLKSVLQEAKQIPKTLPTIDIPHSVEVSNLVDNSDDFRKMLEAIKAIKLVAEAPVIEVKPTDVVVQEADLKPLSKDMKAVEKAVKALVFPEFSTESVEKLLKKTNKLLTELPENMPSGGGGGGGGRVSPYSSSNGMPSFVTLTEDGALPTASPSLATRIDDATTAGVTYIGKAAIGAQTDDPVWQITKLETSSGLIKTWAGGSDSYSFIWDDRATLITYS